MTKLSIINDYLLKAEGHYYYTLNCWERKKSKEIFFSYFFPEIGLDISCKLFPWRPFTWNAKSYLMGKIRKILLICRLLNPPIAWWVIILKCLCEKKKKLLQNYASPEQWVYLFHPFQWLSFDKATEIVLLEIYANKKQIRRGHLTI